MPSLGKSVRALLKGANDGAPRTQIADLQQARGKTLSEMPLNADVSTDWVTNQNHRPDHPLAAQFDKTPIENMVTHMPWKDPKMFDSPRGEKAARKLMDLLTKSDTAGLDAWTQKYLGGSWAEMKSTVMDFV